MASPFSAPAGGRPDSPQPSPQTRGPSATSDGPTVAGRRVVRTLARDESATVLVLHSVGGSPLIAKVYAAPARERADRTAAVLWRARGPHVLPLLDVSSASDGTVAHLHPRLPRGSAAAWLAERDEIGAGEAVTVLAPLAQTLARLHAAGVAHGRVTLGRVLFDASGSPVMIGFGDAVLFDPAQPEAVLQTIPGVVADRAALRDLAEAVLERVRGGAGESARSLADRIATLPPDRVCDELIDGLFELTSASPVRFDGGPARSESVSRSVAPLAPSRRELRHGSRRAARAVGSDTASRGIGSALRRIVPSVVARWSVLSASRRRAVVAGLSGLAAVILAVALIPGADGPRAATDEHRPGTATPAAPATASGDAVSSEHAPTAEDARTAEDALTAGDPLTAEDPLTALPVLLATRERLLREQDIEGLLAVDEAGSPALAEDTAAATTPRQAPITPTADAATGARVVSALGGAVLVSLAPDSDPASLLMVRGEAGWRIRHWVAAG